MLLNLGLQVRIGIESSTSSMLIDLSPDSRHSEALLGALKDPYTIWTEWSIDMKESSQVVEIVRVMLDRVRKDELTSFVGHPSQGAENPPVTT